MRLNSRTGLIWLFLVMCFVVSACSYSDIWDTLVIHESKNLEQIPQTKPAFIGSVSPPSGATGTFINQDLEGMPTPDYLSAKAVCVDLNPGADELWEPHDPVEKGADFFAKHLQFALDGKNIAFDATKQIFWWFGPLFEVRDNNGKIIRKYSWLSTCFKVNLQKGQHFATISVTTTSGKSYSYSWAFRVDDIIDP